MTLHQAFSLPFNQTPNAMSALSANVSNAYYAKYKDLELIIIDEVSIVGAKNNV